MDDTSEQLPCQYIMTVKQTPNLKPGEKLWKNNKIAYIRIIFQAQPIYPGLFFENESVCLVWTSKLDHVDPRWLGPPVEPTVQDIKFCTTVVGYHPIRYAGEIMPNEQFHCVLESYFK